MNHIKIDLERILSDIDRNIFGGYMELGYLDTRFEYLDLGDSTHADKNNLRNDVRAALERMNFPNVRFPGGNFASDTTGGMAWDQNNNVRHDMTWPGDVWLKTNTAPMNSSGYAAPLTSSRIYV